MKLTEYKNMKLTEYKKPQLCVGTVLRFIGEYPFDKEEPVCFMICHYPASGEERWALALYCVSGYYSGELEYVFPKDAMYEGSRSISTSWLIDNWKKRVYNGCEAEDITVIQDSSFG